jgi:hypothetical protein
MAKVNPPPLRIPLSLPKNAEERAYFEAFNFALYQLFQRTGGSSDIIAGNIVKSVSVSSADSPYSQINKYERIYVDASGGPVTVILLPVATDIYCDVIKTDSSANFVTITAIATINGEGSQDLEYQYESAEIAGNSIEYIVI